jgi:hypothetical protein
MKLPSVSARAVNEPTFVLIIGLGQACSVPSFQNSVTVSGDFWDVALSALLGRCKQTALTCVFCSIQRDCQFWAALNPPNEPCKVLLSDPNRLCLVSFCEANRSLLRLISFSNRNHFRPLASSATHVSPSQFLRTNRLHQR